MWLVLGYFAILMFGLSTMLIGGLGWLSTLVYFVGMPAGAWIVWRLADAPRPPLGLALDARRLARAATGALLAFATVVILALIMRALGWLALEAPAWTVGGLLFGLLAQQAVVAAIEEFTFRGVLQSVLARRYGAGRALWAAALLFSLFHLPNIFYQDVQPRFILPTLAALLVMGLAFGMAYWRAGRDLWLAGALHFGWNVASFGFVRVYELEFSGPSWLTGESAWFPESGLLGMAALLVLASGVRGLVGERTHERGE